MSLQAVVTETFDELERARDLFGSAPRGAGFSSTPNLQAAHNCLAAQHGVAAGAWTGAGSHAYGDAAGASIATLRRAIPADAGTSTGMQAAGALASQGRQTMDAIIADTRTGAAAIAPSTDTPAGRAQLAAYLQNQLARAHAVVQGATQHSTAVGAQIRVAASGYDTPRAGAAGPDDVIVGDDNNQQGRVQMVDNRIPLAPAPPPPPAPAPAPPVLDPKQLPLPEALLLAESQPPVDQGLYRLMMPTEAPPPFAMPNGTQAFYDELTKVISTMGPEDPAMAEAMAAKQLAYQALHQGCSTLTWTGSGLGFVGSSGMFFTALPTAATLNPLAIAAAVFSGMGALGTGAVLADCFTR